MVNRIWIYGFIGLRWFWHSFLNQINTKYLEYSKRIIFYGKTIFKISRKIVKKGNKKLQTSVRKGCGIVVCKNLRLELELGRNQTTVWKFKSMCYYGSWIDKFR
jgi:hypothetical protein